MFFPNALTKPYHLYKAQQYCTKQQWQAAIFHFVAILGQGGKLTSRQTVSFNAAKRSYNKARENRPLNVAICGWDLSHNAAGRVLTLEDLYDKAGQDVTIIGCIVEVNPKRPKALWQPIRLAGIDCQYITVSTTQDLVNKAFRFVSEHPFDVVHLSKPRLPNIIIGRLYQLIWNAKIIMDIDDEELGFTTQAATLHSNSRVDILNTRPTNDDYGSIRSSYWLTRSVQLAHSFDAMTVSNTALQAKYGGQVFPHVRPADTFIPSQTLTIRMRQAYGIPLQKKVVLFFGTPKPHKGLLETALAISKSSLENVLFLIIGDFIDVNFKASLCAIKEVDFKFLPNQPYNKISNFVAMGNVCVCLQDVESLISQHQLPAKVIDALAMGLVVVASYTPALAPLIRANIIIESTEQTLDQALEQAFIQAGIKSIAQRNRNYFINNLSTGAYVPKLNHLLATLEQKEFLIKPNTRYTLPILTQHTLP